MVRVEHAGLTAPELEAASDRLLAGSRHRKLEVEDEATGAAAQPYFAAKGWIADRNAMMRREGPGAVHADIVEVPLAATRDLDIEWVSEYDDVESVKRFAAQREPILARPGCARSRSPTWASRCWRWATRPPRSTRCTSRRQHVGTESARG
jgi:hypothetical protein